MNELALDADGNINIKGTSELMSRVFAFVTEFENSSMFQSVSTDFAKSRKLDGRDVTDFGLTAKTEIGV